MSAQRVRGGCLSAKNEYNIMERSNLTVRHLQSATPSLGYIASAWSNKALNLPPHVWEKSTRHVEKIVHSKLKFSSSLYIIRSRYEGQSIVP